MIITLEIKDWIAKKIHHDMTKPLDGLSNVANAMRAIHSTEDCVTACLQTLAYYYVDGKLKISPE